MGNIKLSIELDLSSDEVKSFEILKRKFHRTGSNLCEAIVIAYIDTYNSGSSLMALSKIGEVRVKTKDEK